MLSKSKLYVWNYFQIYNSSIFNMDFIASTRSGGQQLAVEGFIYSKQKELAHNIISWECVNRRNAQSCRAKLKTQYGHEVGRLNIYTHPADPEKVATMRVRNRMKNRAQATREKTRDIIRDSVAAIPQETIARLPNEETMRQDVRWQRQKANLLPPIPNNDDLAFVLPRNYCITMENTQFLQVDSAHEGRMLIFGSGRQH